VERTKESFRDLVASPMAVDDRRQSCLRHLHPSGHILVRSCRGGYMHSVALSAEAMDTDAGTLAQGIVLTADVSCSKRCWKCA